MSVQRTIVGNNDGSNPFGGQTSGSVSQNSSANTVKNSSYIDNIDVLSIAEINELKAEVGKQVYDTDASVVRYYNGVEWISSDGSNPSDTWEYLVYNWSSEPTLNAAIVGGDVYDYELDGVTGYRFVPNPYDSTQDAFYSDFDGTNLTNLIVARG